MEHPSTMPRRQALGAGLFAAGSGLWSEVLFPSPAAADEPPADAAVGRREIVKGLDGMSRVADPGNSPFAGGHNAAAVISSAFFCREQRLPEEVRRELLALVEARLLTSPIYAARPAEAADPKLVDGLTGDLEAGITVLRSSGHNIIFAATCLKALRDVPEAATPERVAGLRRMVRGFGTGGTARNDDPPADPGDEPRFVQFVFEEFLTAIDLYLAGRGHHGFAGHVLTIGHALVELGRLGHRELARKGARAYWQFVQQARRGADLGGRKADAAPARAPTPLTREYWTGQGTRRTGEIVSSHLVKYPYSLYALARVLRDDALKQRVLDKVYHLTATT
ncbi:MAG TPA: hypothetical protein VD866_07600 [Urbifossiella sp.]|nr:hypothetical protein [Urbifossiella sp.]